MELRHLRYFDAVATERNFTRAAERLGIAQPPLSRQIRELEAAVGAELFDRHCRPVRLTEAGRLLHDQCVRILASVDQLGETIRHIRGGSRQLFIVGVVGSILQGPMPAMIRKFRAKMPAVEVELVELTTIEQVAALKEGRIDAGLGRVRIDDPGIRRERLYDEPLIAALPVTHPLAQIDRPLRLADMLLDTLILYPSHPRPSYADQLLGLFRDLGQLPERVREVREVQTALGLVAAEAGIAIIPHSMHHVQRADICYREIRDKNAVSPIILSQRLGDEGSATILFREISRSELALAPSDESIGTQAMN